jgi:hypothetical protein
MNRTGTWISIGMLILLLAAPGMRAEEKLGPLARFTPEQRTKLLAGEPVFQANSQAGQSGQGQAAIIIAAGLDSCLTIFGRLDLQAEYFPRKTKSEVIKEEGGKVWVNNEFDFYMYKVHYTSLYTIDRAAGRFTFDLDPGYPHNLPASSGYFLFEKIDDRRTLFTYAATRLDTGIKVPAAVQDYLTSRDLPAQAVNVRKRIESGGKWKDK